MDRDADMKRFAILILLFLLLSGCTKNVIDVSPEDGKAQTTTAVSQNTAPPFQKNNTRVPLTFSAFADFEGVDSERQEFFSEEDPGQALYLVHATQFCLTFSDEVDKSKLTDYYNGSPDCMRFDGKTLTINPAEVGERGTVTIQKGLKSVSGQILKQDIILFFGGTMQLVTKTRRIDPKTGEALPNDKILTKPSIKVRLSFNNPVVRKSVEDTVLRYLVYKDFELDPFAPKPKTAFSWESDTVCYFSADNLSDQYCYSINLNDAKGQKCEKLFVNFNRPESNFLTYQNVTDFEPLEENYVYSFEYKPDIQKIQALSFSDGSVRDLLSLTEGGVSFGPFSRGGRYAACSLADTMPK